MVVQTLGAFLFSPLAFDLKESTFQKSTVTVAGCVFGAGVDLF